MSMLDAPDVLLVLRVLRNDCDLVGNKVDRVETHPELADEAKLVSIALLGWL